MKTEGEVGAEGGDELMLLPATHPGRDDQLCCCCRRVRFCAGLGADATPGHLPHYSGDEEGVVASRFGQLGCADGRVLGDNGVEDSHL